MKRKPLILLASGTIVVAVAGIIAGPSIYRWLRTETRRSPRVLEWIRHPEQHPDWAVQAGVRCGGAPFVMPTSGYIGYLRDDSFRLGQRHQGVDIFGGAAPGEIPVVAAYPGYLTRLPDWKSTVAVRIPSDPFQPGRQIWTYYTHMATPDGSSLISDEFPPGASEVSVEAGTPLGSQGNYSGTAGNPVGVHLHFSIVLDNGENWLRNELDIRNTLDPSPYLGIDVNADSNHGQVPVCER